MRSGFTIALLITVVFATSFFWYQSSQICAVPVYYSIGTIDEAFGMDREELHGVLREAEAIWEEPTGKNLFVYEEGATELQVNLLFDARQARAVAEEQLREDLDKQQSQSEKINATYAELREEYESASAVYEKRAATYEVRRSAYNDKVASYNEEGGAPPGVFEELQKEAADLEAESEHLSQEARRLNVLVDKLNAVSDQGNEVVERYNENVERYNRSFTESTEFTQGDYAGESINIYKFSDRWELKLVIAHEMGHALSLDHVEGSDSVMYYLLGEQPKEPVLTEADVAAYRAVCEDRNFLGLRWPLTN